MLTSKEKIDYVVFCDLHSVTDHDRFTIEKKYGNMHLTIDEWYKLISPDFNLKEKQKTDKK